MPSTIISSSQPQSVTVADLNNDHHLDIIVANSGTNTIGILLSNADGTFQEQKTISTGSHSRPCSVVVSDFNHDQYFDIAVAIYDINSIGIFLGNGNATFKDQQLLSLGSSHPLFVTIADVNNDNHTDLLVANNGTDSVSILLGYGNGSFQDQQVYSTGYDSRPSSIAVADFNQDKHLDLAVTNYGTNNIGIFLGYGNGIFSNQTIHTTAHQSNPSSLVIADFNYDDQLDIGVSNVGTGNIGIFFGHGNGIFSPQITYSIGSNSRPQYISVGHFDEDNILDLVIIDSTNDHIHILLGYGNGSFATLTTYDTIVDSKPIWISVVDLNKNNQSDIVVVNYGANNVVVLIDYFFQPSARQTNYGARTMLAATSVAISDFDNDSILDIVFGTPETLFILTGIGNGSFTLDKMYSFSGAGYPQYIRVIDLNNDNRTDIISANIVNGRIDIFLGYGNGTFATMMSYSSGLGSNPEWLDLGDLNHDNVLDIVSANTGSDSIGILLGNGNGSFAPMMTFATISQSPPMSVALGCINNDNHLDLVVVDYWGWITIYRGIGNGSFIFWKEYAINAGSYLGSVALADFNNDNHLDIVVTDTVNNNVGVLLGYSDGTFAAPTHYPTGSASRPLHVVIDDFNNDNVSDIAVTNFGNDEVVIFYGHGDGSFQLSRMFSTDYGSKPYGIAAADFDNDQQLEIVVTFWGLGNIAVLTEYVAAKFVNQTSYSTGSALHSVSVAAGDFNNDNKSDIVVANSGTDNLHVFFGSYNGTFDTEMTYPIGTNSQPQYVITCYINNDSYLDIVSMNSNTDSISVILGYGNGSFADQLIYFTGNGSHPSTIASGDMNNDNRLDLVVVNEGTDEIVVFFGFEYASFHDQVAYSTIDNKYPNKMVVRDFNNDHHLDIAVVFRDTDSFGIFFGYGNGSFTSMVTYSTGLGSNSWGIAADDFNKDTSYDIVVLNVHADSISVFLGYGNGSFALMVTYSTGNWSSPADIAVGDCNNDHRLDIIVANYNTSSVGVLLGHENGTFSVVKTYSIGKDFFAYSISVGDFNDDSNLDIAVVCDVTSSIAVLFGYGDGTFEQAWTWSPTDTWTSYWISVGDFNRDNQLDLATANSNINSVGIFLGYGNGTFASVRSYSTGIGSSPRCINIGDLNNDNILDIVVANQGTHDVVVLFGVGDGSFLLGKPFSTGLISPTPFALAMADFNNDSRLDIAVTNSELNNIGIFLRYGTEPFGSVEPYIINGGAQPHAIAVDDVDKDGWLDIVVTNYRTNGVSIFLALRGDRNFRYIKKNLTESGSAPSSITLADVNNDSYLDILVTNSATDNINIFFGHGNGTFVLGERYSTGDRSGPYTLTIADFNNDHILDIAIANSGTSDILLLYGNGNGTFGHEVRYNLGYGYHPTSIVATNLNDDNRMDIVIACYDTDHFEILRQMC